MTQSSPDHAHVAVLAFPFGCHPWPLLNLTCKLARATPHVHFLFFNTSKSNQRLFSTSQVNLPDNLKAYDVADGVPNGHVFTPDNPIEELGIWILGSQTTPFGGFRRLGYCFGDRSSLLPVNSREISGVFPISGCRRDWACQREWRAGRYRRGLCRRDCWRRGRAGGGFPIPAKLPPESHRRTCFWRELNAATACSSWGIWRSVRRGNCSRDRGFGGEGEYRLKARESVQLRAEI